MKHFICLLFIFFYCNIYANERTSKIELFSKFIDNDIKKQSPTSMVIAIVTDKEAVYEKIHGKASNNSLLNKNTTFRIASVSKFITSLLLNILHSKKKLDINSPIRNEIDEIKKLPTNLQNMTLKDLLSHLVSIPYHFLDTKYISSDKKITFNELNSELHRIKHSVKYQFSYQNVTFNYFISKLLEKKFSKDIKEIFDEFLVKPLELKNFTLTDEDFDLKKNRVDPMKITNENNKLLYNKVPKKNYQNIILSGGMGLSLEDSEKILMTILSEKEPFSEKFKYFFNITSRTCGKKDKCYKRTCLCLKNYEVYYCMGLRMIKSNNTKIFYHFGGLSGVSTVIAIIPEKKLGFIAYLGCNNVELIKKVLYEFIKIFS